jgi:hypothetical protein
MSILAKKQLTVNNEKSKISDTMETSKSNSKLKGITSKVLGFFKLNGSKSDEDTAPDTPPKNSKMMKELREMKKSEILAQIIEAEGITDERQIRKLEKHIDDMIDYGDIEDDDYLDAFYDGEYYKDENEGDDDEFSEEEMQGKNAKKLPGLGRSKSTKDSSNSQFSIDLEEDDDAESVPKLKKSLSSDESYITTNKDGITIKRRKSTSFIEISFDENKQWDKDDLESERLYNKDEEIRFNDSEYFKVFKSKSKKKGFKLFNKEVRYITFQDGVMYVTKKKDENTAIIRSVILLSRLTQVELEEEKKTVYFSAYTGDLNANITQKEYKCDDFEDFLDRLDWELEPLNSSIKLLENK